MEKELSEKLNKIGKDITEIKTDVAENKIGIAEIKTDVAMNKIGITEIKTDVAVNKINIEQGFKETKKELSEIKTKINETRNAVDGFIKIVDKLETEFTAMKEDIKRVKKVIREKLGVNLS